MAGAFVLQQLLAESAARRPERTALLYEDAALSYGELEARSNQLARVLRERGVRPGDRVALYTNKSFASVIGIHGILKSGAAYVPLDPNSPAKRLAWILGNCGVRQLVASTAKQQAIERIREQGAVLDGVVCADGDELLAADPTPPPLASIETDLAYILYTSGSTGTPKGVMITHRNALAFVDWAVREFAVGEADRLSSHAPLHFDLSIFDVFGALAAGASLALIPDGTSTFPLRLAEWIAKNRITVWYSVPSILTQLLQKGRLERHDLSALRLVLFAGEVFPTRYLRGVMAALPAAEFCNLYGPTETNVITWYRVPPLPEDASAPIPIGRACANTDLLIVADDGRRVTGPGQQGELYARGPTVAQGYWADPERSERSFVRNPFQPAYAERVYRTGDIVALAPDGNLQFLGRRDRMVKSRGYRIELDEIESVLYQHPQVKEAAVVAFPDEEIGSRILAFLACADVEGDPITALREHCAARLPRYMLPESFALLPELPKTSTGKVDRTALAAGGQTGAGR
jgi:amino acid adenylation domain-containing protein